MIKKKEFIMQENHMEVLYNSKNPLVRFVHRNRLKEIVGSLQHNEVSCDRSDKKALKILDAGCGEGHLLRELNHKVPGNILVGADTSEIALRQAKRRCDVADYVVVDLRKMSFANDYFDVIICTETIEHIIDSKQVIEEFKRILKPTGSLIITFPNEIMWTISRFLLRRDPIKVPDHVNYFYPNHMKKLTKMNLIYKRNLPFKFVPNFISLGYFMHFKNSKK